MDDVLRKHNELFRSNLERKMDVYFYHRPKRMIEPVKSTLENKKAKVILDNFYENRKNLKIPSKFIENWGKVALYHPKGDLDKANSILLEPENGAYTFRNKFNDLTGKEWIKFTCSWFIFNALKEDIKQEKALDPNTESHPATFSPTMISEFVSFFTKEGDNVLDPFMGIGSTAEACKRTGRNAFGTELNPKYHKIAIKRAKKFKNNIVNGDALLIDTYGFPQIDFSISSPPYWDILNRSTRDFKKVRESKQLDTKYSENNIDLGNINDYDEFIKSCAEVYIKMYKILRKGAHIVIIIKNVKKEGKFYPLAWDLAKELSSLYELKDEKIWIQDKIGLAPYGYPFSWTSNILHHYCLILKKT
jgi:DNA modification methylase